MEFLTFTLPEALQNYLSAAESVQREIQCGTAEEVDYVWMQYCLDRASQIAEEQRKCLR